MLGSASLERLGHGARAFATHAGGALSLLTHAFARIATLRPSSTRAQVVARATLDESFVSLATNLLSPLLPPQSVPSPDP